MAVFSDWHYYQYVNETIDTQPRMGNPLTIFHGTRFISFLFA